MRGEELQDTPHLSGLPGGADGQKATMLVEVRDLSIVYRSPDSVVNAVDGVSFVLRRGEILGIVGESGSGKTTVVRSIIGLLRRPPAEVNGGEIWFDGQNLLELSGSELRQFRGSRMSMVFQDPFASLNPCIPVGKQIAEALQYRTQLSRKETRARVLEVMALVGIPEPRRRLSAYPDELSGGLRQRIVIASALALSPDLVLADEPTTALDVTIQQQILTLLRKLRAELDMSVVIVSHDLGVIAQTCDRVLVMYAGRVVEEGPVDAILGSPAHPYTRALIEAMPQGVGRNARLRAIPGAPPDLTELPEGCAFAPRCGFALGECLTSIPPLARHSPGRLSACIRHSELENVP